MGLYGGFRQSEWSQDTNSNPSFPDRNHMGSTQAFTLADFSFFGAGDIRLSLEQAVAAPPNTLSSVDTCWRTQKNKQHGRKNVFPQISSVTTVMSRLRNVPVNVFFAFEAPPTQTRLCQFM
jgi:hypothetical protein